MKTSSVLRVIAASGACLLAMGAWGQASSLPGETPKEVVPTYSGYHYETRDVMIPMRDGVKLHTVILVPKGARGAGILLTRTPYSATALTNNTHSSHLDAALYGR